MRPVLSQCCERVTRRQGSPRLLSPLWIVSPTADESRRDGGWMREGQAPCYTFTLFTSSRGAMFVEVGHSFTQAAPLHHPPLLPHV